MYWTFDDWFLIFAGFDNGGNCIQREKQCVGAFVIDFSMKQMEQRSEEKLTPIVSPEHLIDKILEFRTTESVGQRPKTNKLVHD